MGTRVAVLGATSWGTTLAVLLAAKRVEVSLGARSAAEADLLNGARENRRLLPGIIFPDALAVAPAPDAMRRAAVVLVVVPSQRLRENLRSVVAQIPEGATIVSASKGIENGTCLRMSEVIAEEAPGHPVAVLSGPNLSREIAQGLPASTVIASADERVAREVRDLFITPRFRAYAHNDVTGVELGGSLKNVVALGAGIIDGLQLGDNAKAGFMTRGLAEITRLGIAAGANPLTFAGLAGIGDLIATCASPHSRNRFVGQELARGRSIDDIRRSMEHVSEGVPTTASTVALARKLGVEMPITREIYRVIFEGLSPERAVEELMSRAATDEWAGMSADGFTPSP